MEAFCELNDAGDRMDVHFQYDPNAVMAIKRVPGARFVPRDKGGPLWRLPLDLVSARLLREQFGDGLQLGDAVRAWGHEQVRKETALTRLAGADDAELDRVPKALPLLADLIAGKPLKALKLPANHMLSKKRPARPYQRADIKFMSQGSCINTNQPGTGKTIEVIGAVFEAGMDDGPQLVVAPKTSLDSVWRAELERYQPHPVLVLSGELTPTERKAVVAQAVELDEAQEPFWLVTNPHQLRYVRNRAAEMVVERGHRVYPAEPAHPELFAIKYRYAIWDEYHKMGLTNPNTLMTRSAREVVSDRVLLLSGTPMGGKPIKLWSALNMVDPGSFTSKWRWAEQWLEIVDTGYEEHKSIQGIREGREEEFYKAHAPYLLRRTKAEVLPQLPPKQRVDMWCPMTKTQRKQYETMAANAEIKIEEEHLTATGVLAEYMRLKQFATARHQVKHMASGELKVKPTDDSGKLPYLLEILAERGITGNEEAEGDEKVVVFSQFSNVVDMVEEWLAGQGIATSKITGAVTKKGERTRLTDEFQSNDGPRVMLMTTGAGGVSITLDKASTVVFLDETWDPDDQEQAEDRVHRGSRIHQVTIYYLRSKASIEEYIQEITGGKRLTNEQILDLHRKMFAQLGTAK